MNGDLYYQQDLHYVASFYGTWQADSKIYLNLKMI